MGGLSIDQLSEFLGVSCGTLRREKEIRPHLRKEHNLLRMSIDDFSDILLSNPKRMQKFMSNLDEKRISKRYVPSALLVINELNRRGYDHMEEKEFLTTNDILILPFNSGFATRYELTAALRQRVMFAFKVGEGKFATWRIPVESFALYLHLNPDYKQDFYEMWNQNNEIWEEKDREMWKLTSPIWKALNRIQYPVEETFSLDDLSIIFNIPKNQVNAIFYPRKTFLDHLGKQNPSVSWVKVADYMYCNRSVVDNVYEHWTQLRQRNDPYEGKIRHMLMLYEYYVGLKESNA